mmetsp:Transcript_115446/g.280093  ORF Transcript_115446/g.280093 Transcript_115446/m.280093 type:complete len:181 (-) Transcript_115446:70-612(-)
MLERWLRRRGGGLASDPLAEAAPGHRLRSVRVGPFRDSSGLCLGSGSCTITLHVGLLSRADLQQKKAGYWYKERTASSDTDDSVEVSFAGEPGPTWGQSDGLLVVVAKHGGATMKLRAWWHHAFLQRTSSYNCDDLVLQVRKEWIEGLHRDVGKDLVASGHFSLRAAFEDLGGPRYKESV